MIKLNGIVWIGIKRFFVNHIKKVKEFIKISAEILIIALPVYILLFVFILLGRSLNLDTKDLISILGPAISILSILFGLCTRKLRLAWKRANLRSAVILELKVVIGELIIYFLECYFLNRIRFHPSMRKSFKALEKLMYLYFLDSFKSFDLNHIREIENLAEYMEPIEWAFEMIKKYEDNLPKSTREKLHDFLLFRRTLYQVFENIKIFKETLEIEKFREALRKTISGEDIYFLCSFDERFDYRYKKDHRQYTPVKTYFIKEENIASLHDLDPSLAVKVPYILKGLDRLNKEILSALASNYCTDDDMHNIKLIISEIEDLIAK